MSALPRFSMSVDDGHPLDLRMADLLHSHDIKATFYLPLANQEGAPVLSHLRLDHTHAPTVF